jgi:hypothetical protein
VSRFDTDNTVVVMAAWGMLGLDAKWDNTSR